MGLLQSITTFPFAGAGNDKSDSTSPDTTGNSFFSVNGNQGKKWNDKSGKGNIITKFEINSDEEENVIFSSLALKTASSLPSTFQEQVQFLSDTTADRRLSALALALTDIQQRLTHVANLFVNQLSLLPKSNHFDNEFNESTAQLENGCLRNVARHNDGSLFEPSEDALEGNTSPFPEQKHSVVELAKSLKETTREARHLIEELPIHLFCFPVCLGKERNETNVRDEQIATTDIERNQRLKVCSRSETSVFEISRSRKEFEELPKLEQSSDKLPKKEINDPLQNANLTSEANDRREMSPSFSEKIRCEIFKDRQHSTILQPKPKDRNWPFATCETIVEEEIEDEEEELSVNLSEINFDCSRCSSPQSDLVFDSSNLDEFVDDVQLVDLDDDPDYSEVLAESKSN